MRLAARQYSQLSDKYPSAAAHRSLCDCAGSRLMSIGWAAKLDGTAMIDATATRHHVPLHNILKTNLAIPLTTHQQTAPHPTLLVYRRASPQHHSLNTTLRENDELVLNKHAIRAGFPIERDTNSSLFAYFLIPKKTSYACSISQMV